MAGKIKFVTPLIHPSYLKPIPPISIGWFNPNLQILTNIDAKPQQQRLVATSVSFNPQGSYDLSLLDDDNFDEQVLNLKQMRRERHYHLKKEDLKSSSTLIPFDVLTCTPFNLPHPFLLLLRQNQRRS